MSQSLYRKYRPQTFADVIGQNPIRITLVNEIENNRVAHAYLFSGPRGVGKTTTARLLAKAVNCPDRHGAEPCNKCDFCQKISAGRSMDMIEIDAASHTGVDNVRENIIENARFTPQLAKFKVFIIDEVHMLSVSAFNALLKTLEEPPAHVIFILATTEIHRVPETIISRCQRFDFKRVSVDDLFKRLQTLVKEEKAKVSDTILRNIARRSDGSVRDAEVLLGQILSLGGENITEEMASLVIPPSYLGLVVEFWRDLVKGDAAGAISLINKLIEEGINIPDFNKELIEFLRKVLLWKVSGSLKELTELEMDDKVMEEIKNFLPSIKVSQLVAMIEKFSSKAKELRFAQIIQLPMELAVLEIIDTGAEPLPSLTISKKDSSPDDKPSANRKVLSQAEKIPAKQEKNPGKTDLHFVKVRQLWPKIIEQLKKHNHSIGLSLKVGEPMGLDNGHLTVGFRYKFHAERIKERQVRSVIEEVLAKIVGETLLLKTAVITEDEFNKLTEQSSGQEGGDNTWQDTLQVFGGEISESK